MPLLSIIPYICPHVLCNQSQENKNTPYIDMSIEQQVALAKEMAADLGLTVLEIYADRAISGRSDNRPAFQKMLKDAAKGGFRYVISWKSIYATFRHT